MRQRFQQRAGRLLLWLLGATQRREQDNQRVRMQADGVLRGAHDPDTGQQALTQARAHAGYEDQQRRQHQGGRGYGR